MQSGNHHIPERLVSLFDHEARPVRKGKLKSRTEFCRKVIIEEREGMVMAGFKVVKANSADKTLLKDSIARYQKVLPQATACSIHRPRLLQ